MGNWRGSLVAAVVCLLVGLTLAAFGLTSFALGVMTAAAVNVVLAMVFLILEVAGSRTSN